VTRKTAQRRVLLAVAALWPVALQAQAWLPEQGTFGVSLLYSDIFDTEHYLPNGDEIDVGHMRSQSLGMIVSYSPSDRVSLSAGLPYVRSEYHGDHPHPTYVDNGDYHGFFTDLHVEAHYQLLLDPVAFAPYIALVQPTHNYPSLGHAAPGRNLQEKWLGFFVGRSLDLWIPRTYVQGRYSFAFVQPVAGIGHDRSNVDLEVGYFVRPVWSIRALLYWQHTHGGINVPIPQSNPLYPYHDQLAADAFLNAGVGTAFHTRLGVDWFAVFNTSLAGKNGHKLGRGTNLGFAYSFAPH
jgi:hypothetical protein